mmetsp:Transcript_33543/g.95456  ORF Transcript_33543/g.95456 Transcript_33543/m.95456 type:complete len:356 (+) Transcript_33543:798-1865(+)
MSNFRPLMRSGRSMYFCSTHGMSLESTISRTASSASNTSMPLPWLVRAPGLTSQTRSPRCSAILAKRTFQASYSGSVEPVRMTKLVGITPKGSKPRGAKYLANVSRKSHFLHSTWLPSKWLCALMAGAFGIAVSWSVLGSLRKTYMPDPHSMASKSSSFRYADHNKFISSSSQVGGASVTTPWPNAGAFAPELNGSPVVGRQRRRFQRRPRTIRGLLQHCTTKPNFAALPRRPRQENFASFFCCGGKGSSCLLVSRRTSAPTLAKSSAQFRPDPGPMALLNERVLWNLGTKLFAPRASTPASSPQPTEESLSECERPGAGGSSAEVDLALRSARAPSGGPAAQRGSRMRGGAPGG